MSKSRRIAEALECRTPIDTLKKQRYGTVHQGVLSATRRLSSPANLEERNFSPAECELITNGVNAEVPDKLPLSSMTLKEGRVWLAVSAKDSSSL